MDQLEGVGKKLSDQYASQMRLLKKITYGEFSQCIQEKKSTYSVHIYGSHFSVPPWNFFWCHPVLNVSTIFELVLLVKNGTLKRKNYP